MKSMRIAFLFALSLLAFASSAAAAETPALTALLSPREADALGIRRVDDLAVGPRGEVVIGGAGGAGVSLFALGRREPLAVLIDDPLHDLAFARDGALLAVAGRSLGFVAGGRFQPQVRLPEAGMRLAVGRDRIYLHGAAETGPASVYMIDPDRGSVKLATFPRGIGAADCFGDTLYFSVANDLYRLVPGGELRLLCRVPGPAIAGIAAPGGGAVYFLAGNTLYRHGNEGFAEVARALGNRLARQGDSLYVLDTTGRTLVRLDGLAAASNSPGDAP